MSKRVDHHRRGERHRRGDRRASCARAARRSSASTCSADEDGILACDVRDQEAVDRAVERGDRAASAALDVLVNCAGIGLPQSAGARPDEGALAVIDVNLLGPVARHRRGARRPARLARARRQRRLGPGVPHGPVRHRVLHEQARRRRVLRRAARRARRRDHRHDRLPRLHQDADPRRVGRGRHRRWRARCPRSACRTRPPRWSARCSARRCATWPPRRAGRSPTRCSRGCPRRLVDRRDPAPASSGRCAQGRVRRLVSWPPTSRRVKRSA